jgi:transposase
MKIVAMDLGKSKSVACVYERTGADGSAAHRYRTVDSTRQAVHDLLVEEMPADAKGMRVVIEIGPLAGWVCDLCRALGVEVQVANPNHEAWRWKNVKRKSDRDDALKLARLSAGGDLPLVHVPAKRVREWRSLIEYRTGVVRRLTAVKNSIRAILTREAIDWPKGSAGFTVAGLKELQEMAEDGAGGVWRAMLREELAQFAVLAGTIKRVEEQLDALSAADKRVELLRTIPGVGPRLAETIVAVIDDPHRFRSGKQVGCYAGLTPRRYQSGSMDRQGKISSQGNTLLRSLLVEVAWLGRRRNPWMDGVYENARRGSPARKKIAIVALARRLLVVCWAMLRDNSRWRGPKAAGVKAAA